MHSIVCVWRLIPLPVGDQRQGMLAEQQLAALGALLTNYPVEARKPINDET
jgi:hypothetical protein